MNADDVCLRVRAIIGNHMVRPRPPPRAIVASLKTLHRHSCSKYRLASLVVSFTLCCGKRHGSYHACVSVCNRLWFYNNGNLHRVIRLVSGSLVGRVGTLSDIHGIRKNLSRIYLKARISGSSTTSQLSESRNKLLALSRRRKGCVGSVVDNWMRRKAGESADPRGLGGN